MPFRQPRSFESSRAGNGYGSRTCAFALLAVLRMGQSHDTMMQRHAPLDSSDHGEYFPDDRCDPECLERTGLCWLTPCIESLERMAPCHPGGRCDDTIHCDHECMERAGLCCLAPCLENHTPCRFNREGRHNELVDKPPALVRFASSPSGSITTQIKYLSEDGRMYDPDEEQNTTTPEQPQQPQQRRGFLSGKISPSKLFSRARSPNPQLSAATQRSRVLRMLDDISKATGTSEVATHLTSIEEFVQHMSAEDVQAIGDLKVPVLLVQLGEDWDESCKPKVAKLVHTLYDKYHPNQPKKKGSLQRMFSGNAD
eukprot:FR743504.1.p1 GENE.FR743504.1~~FR743504.1.p1  ORF type:complete len:312 (-),score=9.64 FR743504.1:21-956(-)